MTAYLLSGLVNDFIGRSHDILKLMSEETDQSVTQLFKNMLGIIYLPSIQKNPIRL
jgi:hypothetical protein